MRALLRIGPAVGSIAATISIFVGCGADEQERVAGPPDRAAAADVTYVGSAECARCHPRASADWTGSHHDLAMQIATNETVLGDFADREFDHTNERFQFFRRGDQFLVNARGADGEPADFEIEYAFGVEPLQQYLVRLPGGRLQALSVAWDTRPTAQGGQARRKRTATSNLVACR